VWLVQAWYYLLGHFELGETVPTYLCHDGWTTPALLVFTRGSWACRYARYLAERDCIRVGRISRARLLEGLADDLRKGYPLIAVDARPWVAPRPT
jgi:hypothetical protein